MSATKCTVRRVACTITLLFGASLLHTAHAASATIGILVFDKFLTSDVTAPLEVLGAATKKPWFSSYEVVLISASKNRALRSEEGLNIIADKTIYDAMPLDVLIVSSAYEMDALISNDDLITYIKKQSAVATWMASNCAGAFLLGEAGVLDGKRATTWSGGEKLLLEAYPKIAVQFDQNVVIDSGVITSNGGPVSYQAAFALLEKLSSKQHAMEIAEAIQFDRLLDSHSVNP